MRRQGRCDGSGPGAQVDGDPGGRQAPDRPERQLLGVGPRDVHPRVNADLKAAERDAPGDPGERLAAEAAGKQRIEQRRVAGGPAQERVGLVARRDEPGARERRL